MSQRVLVFDLETSPILAWVWGLHDQNIGLNQIHSDWSILAWSAKWLGEPATRIQYMDRRRGTEKQILQKLWALLDKADVVITQNGRNFDSPKLNARFIEYGMRPPSPYKHLDTYQVVKHVAKFTSNKLEYLTEKLCTKYKKLAHKRFPGMILWTECLKGNKAAWDEMKRYNIRDVLATEELYTKLRAWAPANAPKLYNLAHTVKACRVCGSDKVQNRGFEWKGSKKVQRLQCQSCGKWDTKGLTK